MDSSSGVLDELDHILNFGLPTSFCLADAPFWSC